jgi:ATP-binding cassette subfamily B protein
LPPRNATDASGRSLGGGAVEFNFVTFGYDPAKPVVQDIAFDVPAGSIVALVGPTGAGKSTIVQLLARFYDPQAGQIFIDGVDIRKVPLKNLRGEIGFVFQETFLFSDTVANNIRYGKPEADISEVQTAARIAQAHEFIMELPLGYDTMLGERGASLSGGQRQRLAIARAVLSNPRILVLDDALAAVDPETEHLISRALELVMVDRTVFIIAHRLSTVKASDLVIVLENGRITQAGNHAELLRQHGHYRHIAEVQLAFREKEIVAQAEKKSNIQGIRI